MDVYESIEIPVYLNGRQKWCAGLSKRTTCDDIIYALLNHSCEADEGLDLQSYIMYEKWRDCERTLSGRTKILKLYRAWGSESRNVKFIIRKMDAVDVWDTSSEISRIHKHKRHHGREKNIKHRREGGGRDSGMRSSRLENLGSKSSSKSSLDSVHKTEKYSHRNSSHGMSSGNWSTRQDSSKKNTKHLGCECFHGDMHRLLCNHHPIAPTDPYKSQAFHSYVALILEQEKKLQELTSRVHEVDLQIESYETSIHNKRIQRKGDNYIQRAYLKDRSEESSNTSGDELFPAIKANDLEAYLRMCDGILELQDKIDFELAKVVDLSSMVDEESMLVLDSSSSEGTMGSNPPPPELAEELSLLKADLERSISLSIAQQKQVDLVAKTVEDSEGQLKRKGNYVDLITAELESVDVVEDVQTICSPSDPCKDGVDIIVHGVCDPVTAKCDPNVDNSTSSGVESIATDSNNEAYSPPLASTQLLASKSSGKSGKSHKVRFMLDLVQWPNGDGNRTDSTVTEGWDSNTDTLILGDSSATNQTYSQYSGPVTHTEDNFGIYYPNGFNRKPPPSNKDASMVPYTTYMTYSGKNRPGPSVKTFDDSNSDTGMSSLHSDHGEEDIPARGLETLV